MTCNRKNQFFVSTLRVKLDQYIRHFMRRYKVPNPDPNLPYYPNK